MIAWTVRAAIECPELTHTFVISDGEHIRNIGQQYGAQVIVEPKKLGGARTYNHEIMSFALNRITALGIKPDILLWLQPTSPQRTARDISKALSLFNNPEVDAVNSVCESDNKLLKSFIRKDGYLRFLSSEPWPFILRELLPKTYMSNGAIMAIRAKVFKKTERLYAERLVPYVMSAERSIDIDYKEQALQAERQMRRDKNTLVRPN